MDSKLITITITITTLMRNTGNQAAQNGIQEHTSMLQKLSESY